MRSGTLAGVTGVLGFTLSAVSSPHLTASAFQASYQQTASAGYLVSFAVTQRPRGLDTTTNDQITVIFSNRSVEGTAPPRPLFGDDIVDEFSFSGQDFVKNELRFTRRVRDKSFLGARYIRVVNHGGGGWEPDRISLTVDGEDILKAVPMARRNGFQGTGIQNFNRRNWRTRNYWEAELAQFRGAKGFD
jgi:hypothetical protein